MGFTVLTDKIIYDSITGIGTLQDAINQAQSTLLPLFIKPGNYQTGDLSISGLVTISANPGTVQLSSNSTTTGFTINIRPVVAANRIGGVSIEGLTIFGGSSTGAKLPFASQVDLSNHFATASIFGHWAIHQQQISTLWSPHSMSMDCASANAA